MKGYPRHIATEKDFENLFSMPKHKARALINLESIEQLKDSKATRVISGSEETDDLVTEQIDNPKPRWKSKGFNSRSAVQSLITKQKKNNKRRKICTRYNKSSIMPA